ncbi:MAG: polymerase III catalytic subunit, DnaE type protein [Parcubacteria group bacterium GW2011_GWC2_42_12]|nr:MAG: polymerase III catalytic subunit, DnaE type protein [Parcubacteria group bacterium GW2011_GWC2_42_12]
MKFTHLHVHSHYSLLDGLTKIDELIQKAKDQGSTSLALTDHGVMYGAIEFYQKCKKAGLKPIIGVETYLAPGSRLEKSVKDDEKNYHLVLLAKNKIGFKNLIKLTSIAHLEGFYYKPRIDWEILNKYKDGLVALTACLAGEIPRLVMAGKLDKAKKRILEYNELFGPGNFYLELQSHPNLPDQQKVNQALIALSRELNIPLVATNDIHYLNKDDDESQDVLLCLQTKKKKEDRDRLTMLGGDYSFRPVKEMAEAFKDTPEALANTERIAEQCNLEIELGKIQLPCFTVPGGQEIEAYLTNLCRQGLIFRFGKNYDQIEPKIKERMDYELGVINKMGWTSYFLIVADFVNWAKQNKIVVGPGRGSAAGSLVSYLLNITNIDPLKYDLLFERFLNPDRISMPDIDMDFADVRRDEVIRYVEAKYGKDHVAQIITFGTMAARAAVRDVGRVLNYPYELCDKLAKMIPIFSKISQAVDEVSELRELYRNDEAVRRVIDYAKKLEGVARHASTHACAVIITKDALTEYVPLQYASSSDRTIVSQFSMHPVEDLGLLKMDFLGLKNLTIIESAIKIIKNTRGLIIDIDKIPQDDSLAYKLFQSGETTGVFQFESSGMKRYLRELKPTEFEDIIAMVALYRPGPMEWIPDYINGKQGRKKPKYLHSKLEPILSKTYGVAIYQEQVMQIVRDLAGFTMAEADVLRKAMGKKIAKLLAEQKEKFIDGCVKNGIASQQAEKIFAFIEPFAGYGFNRSHAACYALIGYQTAYLKARWPTEFMAALLTADQENTDRIAIEIDECRHMGIEVMPPDINQSYESFTVVTSGTEKNLTVSQDEVPKTIRFGLKAIKNIGDHIAEEIIKERKQNGPYENITDLLGRICDKDLNKKSLESLIKSGGLDNFGERGQLLGNMENILEFNHEVAKAKNNNQASLFMDTPSLNFKRQLKLAPAPAATRAEKLAWEKDLLGLYISDHPFSDYQSILNSAVLKATELAGHLNDYQVTLGGVITKIKKIMTRSAEPMLFVRLEDLTGSLEILVFPSLLKENNLIWQEGKVVLCQGKLSDKDQELKLLCNKIIELTSLTTVEIVNKFVATAKPSALGSGFRTNGGGDGTNKFYPRAAKSTISSAKSAPVVAARPASQCLIYRDDKLFISLESSVKPEILSKIKEVLTKNGGDKKVFFRLNSGGAINLVETDFKINYGQGLIEEIDKILK